jgi:NADH-quinone oxidoreductase subunit J
MNLYALIFYVLAAVILVATGLAITRRNLVHSVVYLVVSFFGSAMMYYLLGAPLLAALEVIIYAGAIMVLFLFIIMMLRVEKSLEHGLPLRKWLPAAALGLVFLVVVGLLVLTDPGSRTVLQAAVARPRVFGRFLFQRYWLAVEIISFLLLVVLVGVLYLARAPGKGGSGHKEGEGI